MGLTNTSVGLGSVDNGLNIKFKNDNEYVVALAGNPNVGKSTLFNNLTGMKQHTGNWPGKTVASVDGRCSGKMHDYIMVDIPGTYSLKAHSAEEEVARNFICFCNPDATAVVCDATCLERNLNLVLQIAEASPKTLVCVNLLDEAKRKHISVDLKELSKRLGLPVVGTVARRHKSACDFTYALDGLIDSDAQKPFAVNYGEEIEKAVAMIEPAVKEYAEKCTNARWIALRLLEHDDMLTAEIEKQIGCSLLSDDAVRSALGKAVKFLEDNGIDIPKLRDMIVGAIVTCAERIAEDVVTTEGGTYSVFDRKLDKLLTGRSFGYPVMILLLAVVFWLTISGANYPSQLLEQLFLKGQGILSKAIICIGLPVWLHDALVLGIYRVLTWVVSVMLPPMAIFFPMFTLLEDVGYLPRVAYNLDKPFKNCKACGKQALTMCMGFGCNAAGVVGCRIIDSPRERLIAVITNSFVPCNGRFPAMISVITMFFVGTASFGGSIASAALLTVIIILGIIITLCMSRLLSETVLKGVPSSFTLELPPFRRPQVGKVILRSIFDRTLFVLGRAAAVAAPAGLIIWLAANLQVDGVSILNHCSRFLDPLGKLMGLDGTLLMAFILGFPANEIVIPIALMAYMAQGSLVNVGDLAAIRELLVQNGWSWITAVSFILFSLMHWPCSTTVLTIKKETGSLKWTALSVLLPTAAGTIVCILFTLVARLLT